MHGYKENWIRRLKVARSFLQDLLSGAQWPKMELLSIKKQKKSVLGPIQHAHLIFLKPRL